MLNVNKHCFYINLAKILVNDSLNRLSLNDFFKPFIKSSPANLLAVIFSPKVKLESDLEQSITLCASFFIPVFSKNLTKLSLSGAN